MGQTQTLGKHRTTVATQGGVTRVTYHNTVVVAFSPTTILLDSGGWRTPTTKTRMNQTSKQFELGFTVYQRDFEWYVEFNGKEIEFTDRMVLERKV